MGVTPVLTQYLEIKKQHSDAILFFRMGDFYEMFFEDAKLAAPILEVQLTSRDKNSAEPIPMCGVPHHALSLYAQKLLLAGYKIALCEQMEEAGQGKGIIRREVVRTLTPGLIADPEWVPSDQPRFLLCLIEEARGFDVAVFDLLGGSLRRGEVQDRKGLLEVLLLFQPKEILISEKLEPKQWVRDLLGMATISPVISKFREDSEHTFHSTERIQHYVRDTQRIENLPCFENPLALFDTHRLKLDSIALSALEILPTPEREHSLYSILNQTHTPMGRRTLKKWLSAPLSKKNAIEARLECVDNFLHSWTLSERIRSSISQTRDLERLATRIAMKIATPRDLVVTLQTLKQVPLIREALKQFHSTAMKNLLGKLDPLSDLASLLEHSLLEDAPISVRDGGIFQDHHHPELSEIRLLCKNAKETLLALENRERENTGISSLKIRHSKVFGYTIEVTKSNLLKVPKHYIRKQTIANGERYLTEELKLFEEKVISSEERLRSLEEFLFKQLREEAAKYAPALYRCADALAEVDILLGFAKTARERGYCRPNLTNQWDLEILQGRHPVIESLLPSGSFVPNDVSLNQEDCRTLIITGPNMAGKSTAMRQVALIALMAHAGSFVPADEATLPLIDAIFTRIGSGDDLTRGRSTFMVEMTEIANILSIATPQSLIVIDEVGRGTSTYDGLSLAWSLLEYLHTEVKAKTIFSTHFHELTTLEKFLPGLKNAHVLVEKWQGRVVFLHKLVAGICQKSFGIEVAQLAQLPPKVLVRAKEILNLLETQSDKGTRARHRALEIHTNQMVFFDTEIPSENRVQPES